MAQHTIGPYEVVKLYGGCVGVAKVGMGAVIATFHNYVDSDQPTEAEVNAHRYVKALGLLDEAEKVENKA